MATATNPVNPRRQSSSSAVYAPSPPDTSTKRMLPREVKFTLQYGSRLHSYGREKAPYPMSYNREDLELWTMDYELIRHTKNGACSFVDFKGKYPRRCLDVGTGLGTWVIDAAKEWPDCTFVGYDLMNVQIPLTALPPDIANRIEWVHGNFLRTRFPFEDEEFDHVHIGGVAFGVPENKWPSLYEEIRRVMRTDGTIEQIEEDAIFPVLPRWFTEPLHTHARGPYTHFPDGSHFSSDPPGRSSSLTSTDSSTDGEGDENEDPHQHALLESLFRDVFENRFINPTPSSCLPSYFCTTFGHVLSPPILAHPMPPLAPLAPLAPSSSELSAPAPQQIPTPITANSRSNSPINDYMQLPPVPIGSEMDLGIHSTDNEPEATEDSVTMSNGNGVSGTNGTDGGEPTRASEMSRTSSSTSGSSSTPSDPPSSLSLSRSGSASGSGSGSDSQSSGIRNTRTPLPTADFRKDSTSIGDDGAAVDLFPVESLLALDEHSLNMALFRALGLVLSAKEAMWEELMVRVGKADPRLRHYGWETRDYEAAPSRVRFEGLVEQYRKDVRARISLWHSMVLNGWEYPRQDPLSRAEMMEEERLRQNILEARRRAKEEDLQGFSRLTRLMVGVKVRMDSLT